MGFATTDEIGSVTYMTKTKNEIRKKRDLDDGGDTTDGSGGGGRGCRPDGRDPG